MIKAIIFDFGQTLVDSANGFRNAEKIAEHTIFSSLFPDPKNGHWQSFLTEYRHIRKDFHSRSDFSRPSIWQAVFERYNVKADSKKLTQMETDYWERVNSKTTLFPETVGVLEELTKRFRLAIITNTQGQKATETHRIALFPDIKFFFETIIVAGESEIPAKPNPEPFLLCLKKMNLKPWEAIYVGDDFQKDICGASNVGMHPVWIKHERVKRTWEEPENNIKFHVITNLNHLLESDFSRSDL